MTTITSGEAAFEALLGSVSEEADFLVIRDRIRDVWIIAENDRGEYWATHFPNEDFRDQEYKVDVNGIWFRQHQPLTVLHAPGDVA